MRIKPRKRLKRDKPDALAVPERPNQVWSMDFMADRLGGGRAFRLLNLLDDFNREGLGIEADFSLPAERVIRVDNGPEYISFTLMKWAQQQDIALQHIQPGNPQQNAYVERYNRTVRHEWLGNTSLNPSRRCRITPRIGYGPTTMTVPIWALAA